MTLTEFARKGGKARAEKLTPERRSEIARLASDAAKSSGKLLGRPKGSKVKP